MGLLQSSPVFRLRFCAGFMLAALVLTLPRITFADSGSGLKTINNPGGGQVVYGPLTNITSQRDAMIAMLRNVHSHFGDKPQIGKFFQAKGSDSIATFFQLTAKSQGNKPIAGMIVVSVPAGAKNGAAAVLYDDAARFGKTQPAMMNALNKAWHAENTSAPSSNPATSSRSSSAFAAVGNGPGGVFGVNIAPDQSLSQPLKLAVLPDNTGSIGLPAGWRITGGSGGALHAEGPKGESLHMGVIFGNNYDPHTPQGSSMISYMSKGSVPFTACSLSSNLVEDFQCVSDQNRRRQNKQPISIHVVSSKFNPGDHSQGAFLMDTDFSDGKGPMVTSMKIGVQRMGPGNWMMTAYQANVPRSLADGEWPTIQAMIMSYRQNAAAIQQQTQEIIAQINAHAEANRKLAQAKSDANDAHNRQVDETWDVQAKENKAFENYTLDRAVVQDNEVPAHGTFTYPTADWLVKSDPNRFQYVATQDLVKGVDY